MTTEDAIEAKEMIAVLEAYIKGEEIEFSRVNADIWVHTRLPSWNWEDYKYRIKPKEEEIKTKFKKGDTIVNKHICDGTPLDKNGNFIMVDDIDLSKEKYRIYDSQLAVFEFFDIKIIDESYVNTDDCLWYWEYRDVLRDSWHTHGVRLNKAAYKNLCTDGDWDLGSEPIYQLGARLKKELKIC
ncbi:hypothetical protein [Campylobacter hyointestinalis]|uniref:hypothetical protein n=1 Tax=Campylobacter hyointestinalis TaxID=198 RepID=UPI0007260151|nr:hypothetical protein [Campylobacter hyointestinalis]CUU84533.1 Uncharacterised protein [Campylobacter hyointestinalis subsp. hyointestinalis]